MESNLSSIKFGQEHHQPGGLLQGITQKQGAKTARSLNTTFKMGYATLGSVASGDLQFICQTMKSNEGVSNQETEEGKQDKINTALSARSSQQHRYGPLRLNSVHRE
jgi:hypothetical protein